MATPCGAIAITVANTNFPANIDFAAGEIDISKQYPTYLGLSDPIQFSLFRVEPLLDQAIDILERALRIRADYDNLAAKQFDAQYDVDNMTRELATRQQEQNSNFNLLKAAETQADVTAQENLVKAYQGSQAISGDLVNFINGNIGEFPYAAGAEAYAMRLPFTQDDWNQYHNDQTAYPFPAPNSPGVQVAPLALEAATVQAQYSVGTDIRRANVQKAADDADFDQASARLGQQGNPPLGVPATSTGMYARLQWNQMNAQFIEQRRQNLITQQEEKQNAIQQVNGALNFTSAMQMLVCRYKRDFGDAAARITQAEQGLEQLYGYIDPVYEATKPPLPALDPGPRFDLWVIWLRDAASWLIRFSQTDQQVTVPVSLKALLKSWDDFTNGKVCEISMDPPPGLPAMARHVRLRGLSVFSSISSDDGDDSDPVQPLQMVITLPSESYCVHLDGSKVNLDQSNIQPTFAGRILPRLIPQQADVLGADNLYNASPFGAWQVQLSNPKVAENLDDIYLDLLLKVQMQTKAGD